MIFDEQRALIEANSDRERVALLVQGLVSSALSGANRQGFAALQDLFGWRPIVGDERAEASRASGARSGNRRHEQKSRGYGRPEKVAPRLPAAVRHEVAPADV